MTDVNTGSDPKKSFLRVSNSLLALLFLSLVSHYLFINYFPIDWWQRLFPGQDQQGQQYKGAGQSIEATLVSEGENAATLTDLKGVGDGGQAQASLDENKEGLSDEWGELLNRLEENTGYSQDYEQTFEKIIENTGVSERYIYRDRKHEDIVVKEVFPTIHKIDEPFENILKAAPEQLDSYQDRNEIIEQYRSQRSDEVADLSVELIAEHQGDKNLGPLNFPLQERQSFFDRTLAMDKNQQMSEFIRRYFQYDPNEGDLPIATRELYAKNLERLVYTFSSDPTYHYLDFYLENLNKEDFLHHALDQSARLQGTKTAIELLFAVERIYEIQQRTWRIFFKFDEYFPKLALEQQDRLRVETLKRVGDRYRLILAEKNIESIEDLERKYREKRYQIMEHILNTGPDSYRQIDAAIEQGLVLWEMGLAANDQQYKQKAIKQWKTVIDQALNQGIDESNVSQIEHLKLLEALIKTYERAPAVKKAEREKQISGALAQRHYDRLVNKRTREELILWPKAQ